MVSDWRKRQKQALRRALYETAIELFQVHGYEATTVQQITEKVGVAKGTFFNHFPTKEHVVAAWYDGITFECLEAARARKASSSEETVCTLFVEMARRAQEAPELLIAKSRHASDPLLVVAEQTQDDEIDAFMLEQCEAGKARGEIAADIDAGFLVGLLGDMLTGTSRSWVSTGMAFDFPVAVRERVQFLFRAARAVRS